jgi:hypothetical protein
MRINEFKLILREVISNGDMNVAQITTAKLLTYLIVLVEEAENSGTYTPSIQELYIRAKNAWLHQDYEAVLPVAADLSKEWQQSPSFSVYTLNAKATDTDRKPVSLSGLPVPVSFDKGGLEQVVTTNNLGETVFVGPSCKFIVYGIETADGGMPKINLAMDAKTGRWVVDATMLKSTLSLSS